MPVLGQGEARLMVTVGVQEGSEFLLIDENTTIPELKKEILWNEVYYKFCK